MAIGTSGTIGKNPSVSGGSSISSVSDIPDWPSNVSVTEIGYSDGLTGNIQTQINGKANSSHTHAASDITEGVFDSARIPAISDSTKLPLSGGDMTGNIRFADDAEGITADTADGADNQSVVIAGGGASGRTRGATVFLYGNEHASLAGQLILSCGSAADSLGAGIVLQTVGNQHLRCFGASSFNYNRFYVDGGTHYSQIIPVSGACYIDISQASANFEFRDNVAGTANRMLSIRDQTVTHEEASKSVHLKAPANSSNSYIQLCGSSHSFTPNHHVHRIGTTVFTNSSTRTVADTTQQYCGFVEIYNSTDKKVARFRFEQTTVTLSEGDSGHFAVTDTASRLCVYPSGNNLILKNNLGSSKDIAVRLVFAT